MARDQFWYDTDDQRVQSLESWDESGTLRTRRVLYLGGDVEEVRAPANATHDRIVRLQVTAVVRAIARRRASDQVWEAWYYEYAHRDHLGSVDVITNSAGVVQQKTSFDPYGGRRSTTWNADLPATGLAALRDWQDSRGSRGFTDHEHLSRTGFVHMNGRVYDPRIGRFVSPDPIVQAPWFSQSYNRYAYVFGSPVSYTDPSGFAAGALHGDSIAVVRNPRVRSGLYESGSEGLSFSFVSLGSGAGSSGYYNPEAGLPLEFELPDIPNVVPPTPAEPPSSLPYWLNAWDALESLGRGAYYVNLYVLGVDIQNADDLIYAVPSAAINLTVVGRTGRWTSKALSEIRYTQAGEKFYRYESANPAFSRVTPSGGVTPGTYAAPVSDGLVPVGQRISTYNLPSPNIPRPKTVVLEPPAGTPIIGPRSVSGGTGNEVIFPSGF